MRNAMLLGSLTNNAETMINVSKKDVENLEKPDTCFLQKVLPTKAKTSKVFRYLELGLIPVRFVLKQKRLKFLKYILNEDTESMLKQVYDQQKKESRKGDFVFQVKQDMKEMDINMDDNEIKELSIRKWKKLVNEKTKEAALRYLVSENRQKEKTKHIKFKTLKLSEYLRTNKNTNISNIIFSLRSGGLDIKTWNKWKYDDNLCVMCENKEENMDHLMECLEYGETKDFVWREVFET